MEIIFREGLGCGFNQHNNNAGKEEEETMKERGCRGRWSVAYKEKQSHTVCREQRESEGRQRIK